MRNLCVACFRHARALADAKSKPVICNRLHLNPTILRADPAGARPQDRQSFEVPALGLDPCQASSTQTLGLRPIQAYSFRALKPQPPNMKHVRGQTQRPTALKGRRFRIEVGLAF